MKVGYERVITWDGRETAISKGDIPFLQIYKGERFKVYIDGDAKPFIQLKSKLKIYLTKHRLNYFDIVD